MNSSERFYLDYNATTPLHPEVRQAMFPFLDSFYGNPSSVHSFGRESRAAMDAAREILALEMGAKSKEIVFTSGGTESSNLALFGAIRARREKGKRIVTCSTEHHAVLRPCEQLQKEGFECIELPVDAAGRFSMEELRRAVNDQTVLVSIMSANNETGLLNPIAEVGSLCRERKVLFHCDAVQSFGKQPVKVDEWKVDLLSIAAHKFYGPKGVGALYVRSGTRMVPVQWGGWHENERRAGTENVAGIVGMGKACSVCTGQMREENDRLFQISENLWSSLSKTIPGVRRNGDPNHRLGNTLSVSFEDCDGEGLLMGLDLEGLAVSSGSACMVGSIQPSHVLTAMGLDEKMIRATVRFSLGKDSSEEQIPKIVKRTSRVVERLRVHSK